MWLQKSRKFSESESDPSKTIRSTISSLRSTFATGITLDVSFRKRQLERLLEMMNDHETTFLSALKSDLGKPKFESILTETDFMRNDILGMLFNIDKYVSD